MNDPNRIDPLALINEFAQKEKQLANRNFLAPVTAGAKVRVQVEGVVYDMVVDDARFQGWGVFRMSKPGHAQLVERAPMSLVGEYLKLFPCKRFVLIDMFDGEWFGIASSSSDTRFALSGPVAIRLAGVSAGGGAVAVGAFDTVCTRFDGAAFWFECVDRRRDPVVAREMRRQLEEKVEPDAVRVSGMTPEDRIAYRMLYLRRYHRQLPGDDRSRIAAALRHSDAVFESYMNLDGAPGEAVVRFAIDGVPHTATISTSDLSVVSAGICLSGKDRDFDLSTLVGVFREFRGNWGDDHGW